MDFSKSSHETSSPFDCLMFDMDDTLYSSHTGLGAALKANIDDYLVEKCGFGREKAASLRVELFKTYGSTLAGLRALGYDIDADDYHSFVHGRLPYERIGPNPQLRNLLLSTPQRKIIFTNSDGEHAKKVLSRLGLNDCFEHMICFETLNPNLSKATRPDEFPVVLKPSIEAFNITISSANIVPHRTLFLDDNDKNIRAGKALGLKTVLVGKTVKILEADYVMETVNNIALAIPEIWMMTNESSIEIDGKVVSGRTRSDVETPLMTVGA